MMHPAFFLPQRQPHVLHLPSCYCCADGDAAVQCEGHAQLQAGAGRPGGAALVVCAAREYNGDVDCWILAWSGLPNGK